MSATLTLLAALLATAPAADADADPDTTAEARAALAAGSFPWYDAEADAVRPLTPEKVPETPPEKPTKAPSSLGLAAGQVGQIILFALMAGGLIAVVIYFARTWNFTLAAGSVTATVRAPGKATRIAELPAGLTVESDDPKAEALRRRDRGDLAGAIVCLFVHLLLTLERRGLVRLAPGRTARQLVRSIGDDEARRLVEPTLRQFEAAYYGGRSPSAADFADAWDRVEALERRPPSEVTA